MRAVTSESELDQLSTDAGLVKLRPQVAFIAESEEDVAKGVREGQLKGLAVTPRGGGTSIPSQSVGRGAILLQDRGRISINGDGTVTCEPGVVKADFNKKLTEAGVWMPVDPSSYASCTLGGMVANNSSGARTLKYGSTIDYVRGLRVVLPGEWASPVVPIPLEQALTGDTRTRRVASLLVDNEGVIRQERPRVTKNSSGYRLEKVVHDGIFDLPKLLAGSEGTLCVFTEATLRVKAVPKWKVLLIVESTLEELDAIAGSFAAHGPSALELVDKSVFRLMGRMDRVSRYSRADDPYLVFCEFDGDSGDPSAKLEEVAGSKAGRYEPMVISSPSEIAAAWEVRSETLTIAQEIRREGKSVVPGVEDLVVPPDRLADLLRLLTDEFERRGLEYISYGHAGDANLHARPFLDMSSTSGKRVLDDLMEGCFRGVWKMGGSMTGEHGDGMLRARFVERQYPKTYWIMKEVKALFDPKGTLNPGVKLPSP